MAVKLESQDKNKPSKKKSSVTYVNFRKKANPYEEIIKGELKYTPVPPHLLRREEVPIEYPIKSTTTKEAVSKPPVVSTRSKGDIFDNDPPFDLPHVPPAANDGDLCQDLNPRLKAWLASFCPIPANICWLDRPSEYYRKRTESSQKVRLKVNHQQPSNKRYCYLPLNPVLGWRGLRPPTVNDLIQRAYKDGKSFLSPAQRRNIYGIDLLSNSAPTTSPHTPFSQGAKLDQSDRECAEAHVDAWLDTFPADFGTKTESRSEASYSPVTGRESTVLRSYQPKYTDDYETAKGKPEFKYNTCDEHIRLYGWLSAAKDDHVSSHAGRKFPLADTTHLWCEQEREFERYKEVLFVMQYTTPHIDYLPDAVDLEIEGQLVKAGSRHLGWYIGAVAPIERYFKRTGWDEDLIWKSFCHQAQRFLTGEISLDTIQKIGKYNYRRHRLGVEASKKKAIKATTANDSEFLSTVVANKYRKKVAEQRIYEERVYREVLHSGHESRPAAPLQHLVLARGWKKLGSLLVPPGYDETSGLIVYPPSIEVHHDADKLSRLKTG